MLALGSLACGALACRPIEDGPRRRTDRIERPEQNSVDQAQPSGPAVPVGVPNFAELAQQTAPSVVAVISTVPHKVADQTLTGIGSGMIVSTSGQILTNEHVVSGASDVDIELQNGERVPAKVVYADPLLDLALLELTQEVAGLVPVEFREEEATPGEWVMAVGQPFGLGHTVTVGVIGGLGRDWDDLGRPASLRSDGIWSFIQTDASINIGNSGGPLVDITGKVVGLTTAVRQDGQGLAFAVPAQMARRFLDELWTYGRLRHPKLGIRADNAGPEVFPGRMSVVRVTYVDPDGPADVAGIAEGDLILRVADQRVGRVSEVAYQTQLGGVGNEIVFTIKHGEEPARNVALIPDEG